MRIKRDFIGMFDVFKGILLLLVTLAHTSGFVGLVEGRTDGGGIVRIYGLMPIAAFFMISGYSFRRERSWTGYLKRQVKSLLIPYFMVPVIAILFRLVLYTVMGREVLDWIIGTILGFLWGATQPMELLGLPVATVGAMWFLPTLFLGGVLHQAVMRVANDKGRCLLLWSIVLAGACVPSQVAIRLPWFLTQSCTCLGYLELGRLIKAHKLLHVRVRPVIAAVAVGAAALLAVFFQTGSDASLWANIWTYGALDYFGSALIAVVLFRLYLRTGLAAAKLAQPLAYIGRYSLYFLTLHGLELVALPWGNDAAALFSMSGLSGWGLLLLIWSARSVAALLGCAVINRIQSCIRRHAKRGHGFDESKNNESTES